MMEALGLRSSSVVTVTASQSLWRFSQKSFLPGGWSFCPGSSVQANL